MAIHIFRSGRQPDTFGFTRDRTGSNLPSDLGPWTQSVADSAVGGQTFIDNPAQSSGGDPMSTALERNGYYVANSETISRRTGVPWVD